MNLGTMRKLDRWLGVPLCSALTALRAMRWLRGARSSRPVQRILLVKLAEQGSTVLAASAIHRATELVGPANVYMLVFQENRFIVDMLGMIPPENVITIRTKGIVQTLANTLAALRRVRRLKMDAAVDMEFFARSTAAISYLSGARMRIGFHAFQGEGPYRGNLMTHRLRFNPHMHAAQTFRMLVDAIEQPAAPLPTTSMRVNNAIEPPPQFVPGEAERARVSALLREGSGRVEVGPVVLLNANCSDMIPLRAWPRERYVDLARRLLSERQDLIIGLTGGPGEAQQVQRLADDIGSERCVMLAGRTSLRELLVLYSLADVLVTNDSGPAHFATMTPIDIVVLFGPEHPALFAPQGPRSHVIWAGLTCSPCVSALNNRHSVCTNNLCMQSIGVEQVHERVLSILRARSAGSVAAATTEWKYAPHTTQLRVLQST